MHPRRHVDGRSEVGQAVRSLGREGRGARKPPALRLDGRRTRTYVCANTRTHDLATHFKHPLYLYFFLSIQVSHLPTRRILLRLAS